MLETVLREMREFRVSVEGRLTTIEHQLEQMDIRLDELASFAHQTRSEILALRATFKTSRIEAQRVSTSAARGRSTRSGAKGRA
jgi:hypothetical protein